MYKKYVTFSFDDGLEQDKRLIGMMNKYGLKGTFNISAGLTGKKQLVAGFGTLGLMEKEENVKRNKMLTYVPQFRIPADELRQVYDGFEVASHAFRHEPLPFISEEAMKESVDLDLENLEKLFGYRIYGHAYAKGMTSRKVQNYLRTKGIVYARGVRSGKGFSFPENPMNLSPTCSHISKNVFELIDRFLAAEPADGDMLMYIWGHGYECDYNAPEASWYKTEKIFDKLSGRDDLVYCTNLEAFTDHNNRKQGGSR